MSINVNCGARPDARVDTTAFLKGGAEGAMADNEDELVKDTSAGTTPRYSRRLSDKILIAFHHACDQAEYEVAEQLVHVLETLLTRRPMPHDGNRRRNIESLVAAHERLWHLRHPDTTPD
jgi:hypothetical protein